MATRLTDRYITSIKPVPGKRTIVFDSTTPGLAVKTFASGRKSFVLDFRDRHGRQHRKTLGSFPAWSTAKARLFASQLRRKLDAGEEIMAQRGEPIAVLATLWLDQLQRRPSTVHTYRTLFRSTILPAFGRALPATLTFDDIERWHGEIARRVPVHANRCLMALSAFLSWLTRTKRLPHNPAKGVRRAPETPRSKYLDADQIARLHAALDAEPHRPSALVLKLCLSSGCRIGEALGIRREQIEISRKVWIMPAHLTKQGRPHIAMLNDIALTTALELTRVGVPRYDKTRRVFVRICADLGFDGFRIHDLRHSYASRLLAHGGNLVQIGKLLGHSSIQVTQRYAHVADSALIDLVNRAK